MKKPRLLTKIPRNPDDTKKPRSSGKNPAVATLPVNGVKKMGL